MKRRVVTLVLMMSILLTSPLFYWSGANSTNAEEGDSTKDILDSLFGDQKTDLINKKQEETELQTGEQEETLKTISEPYYSEVVKRWREEGVRDAAEFETVIHPFESDALWDERNSEVKFTVNAPQDGLYQIKINYKALPGKIVPVSRGIKINGEFPFFEARRIELPKLWEDEQAQFERDELDNELHSRAEHVSDWQSTDLMDPSYLQDEPLKFRLRQGRNEITLIYLRESVVLGSINIHSPRPIPDYEDYLTLNGKLAKHKSMTTFEAEHPAAKSDPAIQALSSGDPNVTPYRSGLISLNTFGGATWQDGGKSVTYKLNVERSGYYQLAFKYNQFIKVNMPVFRTIMIDDKVPFKEMLRYPFAFTADWKNETLADSKGEPYQFYLTEGRHSLTLVANAAPYERVIRTVRNVMRSINELSLEIKMATGNTLDVYRDWDISVQLPDVEERLNGYAKSLMAEYEYLKELSGVQPDDARNLQLGADQLERLAAQPNELPVRFEQLSKGSGSVTQKLGDLLKQLPIQPIELDKFYVYSDTKLPKAKAGLWQQIKASIVSFFTTFTKDYNKIGSDKGNDKLEIWVNRPRQYVTLMQQLADREFTKATGIKVSFSLMPSEQKLILANASGKSPDAALGVTDQLPYDLALRGALKDLNEFDDFKEVSGRFSPGALLPFEYNNGYYALPETQNFWVLFYRKDVLEALDIAVPDTWQDVLDVLPKLQRYGMNFFVPLSDMVAAKNFKLTSPFIYQHGGDLFTEDGTRSAIDSEKALKGFKLMTGIYTVYNMPLQVASFYNHFREGSLPIGISDYNTYIQLNSAAPELAGWWKIAPYPGVTNEDGEVVRWAPGTGQSAIMFKNGKQQDQTWKFIKWWTSEQTQVEFGNTMETMHGSSFRWNTSNLTAFEQLPWPQEDADVIMEQWRWLKDVRRVPGDYMLDRELSNAWNKVVFDGVNPRKAVEDAVLLANREMMKKMEEFGYGGGEPVEPDY